MLQLTYIENILLWAVLVIWNKCIFVKYVAQRKLHWQAKNVLRCNIQIVIFYVACHIFNLSVTLPHFGRQMRLSVINFFSIAKLQTFEKMWWSGLGIQATLNDNSERHSSRRHQWRDADVLTGERSIEQANLANLYLPPKSLLSV